MWGLNKQFVIIAGLILLITAGAGYYWLNLPAQAKYDIERNIRYGFTVQNKTNKTLENVGVYVYGPVKKTSAQFTKNIAASIPYELKIDDLGNQVLHFTLDRLPPFATSIINIDAQLMLSDAPNEFETDVDRFLGSEKYVETDNRRLVELATNISNKTDQVTDKSILEWIHSNIRYSGYIQDDRGALYAYENRTGDCTEFMYLYMAMARIAGIPARGIGGYVYAEDSVLKPSDFHNWVEINDDGKWWIIDPQNGIYKEKQSHFIAMRVLSEAGSAIHLNNTHQFAVAEQNVSIKMN